MGGGEREDVCVGTHSTLFEKIGAPLDFLAHAPNYFQFY